MSFAWDLIDEAAALNQSHPPSFYCPISKQCMHDPVVLCDGHSYERRHIEQWLQEHDTSPVCGAQLEKGCIYPNHALRNAIEEYFQHVFSVHRRAIRSTIQVAGASEDFNPKSNVALLRTVDAFMECSILVNADLSTELVLRRIMDEAKTLLSAEVASVFLVDRQAQELYSNVNSTGGELRIPISAGIAGHVASTGEPVIIGNAYCDKRFNRSVDARTGFTTRSVLCVPLKTRKDGVIGVAQLVNKHLTQQDVTEGFTADDLQFLQVFACQAAAAIANSGFLETESTSSCKEDNFLDFESDEGSEESEKATVILEQFLDETFFECMDDKCDIESVKDSDSEDLDQEALAQCVDMESVANSDHNEGITLTHFLRRSVGLWEMDVGMLSKLTEGKPLSVLCVWIFNHVGFVDHFDLDRTKVSRFFARIEQGYGDVPYHNREHAACVVHMMNTLMDLGGIGDALVGVGSNTDVLLDWMACIVAAAIHDFEHMGLNNEFLTRTNNPRAVLHNDRHVNENHHVAAAFSILRRPEYNFLESLPEDSYRRLRHVVISLVLSTDMADHARLVDAFKGTLVNREKDVQPSLTDQALFAMKIALKCADVGHLSLSWPAHVEWVRRLEQELFAQGDAEAREGVRVSFLMDRTKPGVMETQVGFFDFVVLPLFTTLADAFPATRTLLASTKANYAMWTEFDRKAQ